MDFDEIYDRYKNDVFRFACYLVKDRREAEDIFQDVWLRLVRHQSWRNIEMGSLKPWLMTVAVNLHKDYLRKKRVRRLFFLKWDSNEPAAVRESETPQDIAGRAEVRQRIDQAIAGLPEKQRRVFVLKEIEGLKQEEIAGILGIPVGTVKSLLFRAVKQLRRALSAYNTGNRRTRCDAGMLSV